jgi:transcriptional regulator
MRPNPLLAIEDPDFVRQLVRDNPWGVLVSSNAGRLVASHYPVLLDEEAPDLTILTHVGKPDDELHGLGEEEILVIIQGPHGYISPSWYPPDPGNVPTWNFVVAHLYGVPQILGPSENLEVLEQLTAHFENQVAEPTTLDPDAAPRIARGAVGMRVPISRFVCKRKLSQNKDEVTRRRVIDNLRRPGPYSHPDLADEMQRALEP